MTLSAQWIGLPGSDCADAHIGSIQINPLIIHLARGMTNFMFSKTEMDKLLSDNWSLNFSSFYPRFGSTPFPLVKTHVPVLVLLAWTKYEICQFDPLAPAPISTVQ